MITKSAAVMMFRRFVSPSIPRGAKETRRAAWVAFKGDLRAKRQIKEWQYDLWRDPV